MGARARRTDPGTSHEAADSVAHLRTSQLAVLSVLREHGPMTDTDLIAHYNETEGLPQQSVSGLRTRRRELVDSGEVEDSGVRVLLESNRRSIVWRIPTGGPRMIERQGTTEELRVGSYLKGPDGMVWKVTAADLENFSLINKSGEQITLGRPWQAKPVTILEPSDEEALATVVERLGAEVEAVKENGEPFRCIGLGNVIRNWHTHMHLMHGIHTSTGPGSKSIDKVKEAHALDHEDAAAGHPTGNGYVNHRH